MIAILEKITKLWWSFHLRIQFSFTKGSRTGNNAFTWQIRLPFVTITNIW